MKNINFLPIGTIVKIKNCNYKIIIVGYNGINQHKNLTFDYVGFVYPYGFLERKNTLLFNADIIENIYYMGYKTAEHDEFIALLNNNNSEGNVI